MRSTSVANVYIADGFAEDCNKLIDAFEQKQDLSYDAFCKIFKEMKIIQCFHGRRSEAEIAELSEEVVLISKYFMLHQQHTFSQSVGGLYLLYLMVHLQPFKAFAPVRFIPEDVEPILRFKKKATEGKHYDVLYILGSLLIDGPSEFHIGERPYGLERQLYKYFGDQTSVATTSVSGVLYQDPEKEFDMLRQISNAFQNYKSKKDYVMKVIKSAKELDYVQDGFAEQVQASLKRLNKFNGADDKESPTNGDRNIWALKRRAMRADVKRMRHLSSVKSKNPLNKRLNRNHNNSNSSVAPKSSKTANQANASNTSTDKANGDVVYEFLVENDDNPESQSGSKVVGTDVPIVLDLPMLLDDDIQPSKSGETVRSNSEIVKETNYKDGKIERKTKDKEINTVTKGSKEYKTKNNDSNTATKDTKKEGKTKNKKEKVLQTSKVVKNKAKDKTTTKNKKSKK